jgi:hypothetical protein
LIVGRDGSDWRGGGGGGGQRTRHPLAREGEWEPFICYTVRMQLVLPLPMAAINAAQRAAATPADDGAGENFTAAAGDGSDDVGDGGNASRGDEDGAPRKSEGGMEAVEPEAGGNEAEAEAGGNEAETEGSTAGSLVPLPLSPQSSLEPEEAALVQQEADASHGVTNTNPDSSSGNGTGGTGGTGSSSTCKDEFDIKPSGELQEWFVRFRFTDFLRLQEALEEDIARRQELYVHSILARQERQRQEEKKNRAESAPAVLEENGSVESTVNVQADAKEEEEEKVEEEEKGFRLRVDSELVDELRALLPPARWLKTEHAVVLERRAALQAYLDTALQAKRLPPPPATTCQCITAITTADSTAQGHQASPPVGSTGAIADGSGGGGGGSSTGGRCSDEIVQHWVSAAFLRCATSSGAINHSF